MGQVRIVYFARAVIRIVPRTSAHGSFPPRGFGSCSTPAARHARGVCFGQTRAVLGVCAQVPGCGRAFCAG